MTRFQQCRAALAIAALCAAAAVPAATIAKAEYTSSKDLIAATYKTDEAACKQFTDNHRDVCNQQAKAKDKVALAELEYSYTAKAGDRNKIAVVKADTTYAVEKEKCDDLAGQPKDLCRTEAKTAHTKALAAAKLSLKVGDAVVDAATTRSDADYKLAREKCDSLSGSPQATCITEAKTRFNKT